MILIMKTLFVNCLASSLLDCHSRLVSLLAECSKYVSPWRTGGRSLYEAAPQIFYILAILRQAPVAWHVRLAAALHVHGFIPSTTDTSVFVLEQPQVTMYRLVYVDDIILGCSFTGAADYFITALSADFAVQDLGKLYLFFLGWRLLIMNVVYHSPRSTPLTYCDMLVVELQRDLIRPKRIYNFLCSMLLL
jgi:hypothetical protein